MASIPKSTRDRLQVRRRHKAAGAHQDEHQVHQPEYRLTDHLDGREAPLRLNDILVGGYRNLALLRRCHEQGKDDNDEALHETEVEKRRLETVGADHPLDWRDGQSGAGAETRRRDSRGEATFVGGTI